VNGAEDALTGGTFGNPCTYRYVDAVQQAMPATIHE
jgi:hypothetical protein